MSNVEKKPKNGYLRYILLLLLLLLIGLGIWNCPNLSDKTSKFEVIQKKEDNLEIETSIKSDVLSGENKNLPTNNEIRVAKKEKTSVGLKPEKENNPNIPKYKQDIG